MSNSGFLEFYRFLRDVVIEWMTYLSFVLLVYLIYHFLYYMIFVFDLSHLFPSHFIAYFGNLMDRHPFISISLLSIMAYYTYENWKKLDK